MQPTYLPWLGYFDLLDQVDLFVLLDSVQFSHQTWQHRNRIKTPSGLSWLTVPVKTKGRFGQLIKDVELESPGQFLEAHFRALDVAYSRAPFTSGLRLRLENKAGRSAASGRLVALTADLIQQLAEELAISTPICRSSDLACQGRRSELLVSICSSMGANRYISPPGSVSYLLAEEQLFSDAGIEVLIHQFNHPTYPQLFPPFLPYASVVDLLFNAGPGSSEIMRSGRGPALPLADLSPAPTTPGTQ